MEQTKLPAVSGSSGHLVVERVAGDADPAVWPGQVFGEEAVSFAAAMQTYVQATTDRFIHAHQPIPPQPGEVSRWRKEWEGRAQRHQVLEQRKQEDRAWREAKAAFRAARQAQRQLHRAQRKAQQADWEATLAAWQQRRQQRAAQHLARTQENVAWHQRNRAVRMGDGTAAQATNWLAVLVITDNCTRQCLGLPLFRSGAKVTSQEVAEALAPCLPEELQFVISDQGKHFKTQAMAHLAQQKEFSQVLVYRHRPQSNGIAERFVQTFKRWLRHHSWNTPEELEQLIGVFILEYNQRPHQGLPIPGLSPTEFAERFWFL